MKIKSLLRLGCLGGLFFTLAPAPAAAHTVWIEPLDGRLVARFAEPGGRLEKSPGHLDSLGAPAAFTLVTNAPVTIAAPKSTNHFALVNAAVDQPAGLESSFSVRNQRKPHFYARWQPAGGGAGTPLLTFDLVPTGKPGEVRVYFRGRPLGGLKAVLRTPDDTEVELPVDAEGYIRFESKQRGLHLLMIPHHREPVPGFHLGKPYEQTSHNTALSWVQP
jgi:hypothetical protein